MNGACALCSYSGFHARSLNWQRRIQARDQTSDGQPENLVGRFRKIETSFKHPELKYACVGAAEGCDLLILILIFILKNQSQKIAAFGSSYSE